MQAQQVQTNRPSIKVQRVVNLNAVGVRTGSTKSGLPCWLTVTD
ncbi:hypothetical protein [Spirosoma flavum]|uniref:Uncharacterized protein n=1 Tax=Spirosoma flavum TaxID=2048557 RepID=A0ABW6AHB0_9BACT